MDPALQFGSTTIPSWGGDSQPIAQRWDCKACNDSLHARSPTRLQSRKHAVNLLGIVVAASLVPRALTVQPRELGHHALNVTAAPVIY